MHSWGWATSRIEWQKFSKSFKEKSFYPSFLQIFKRLYFSIPATIFFLALRSKLRKQKLDSWAYPFTFYAFKNSRYSINVNSNLAINIGFDNRATHTKKRNPKIPNKLVKLNEAFTECSEAESKIFDKWEIKNFNMGRWMDFMKALRRTLGFH